MPGASVGHVPPRRHQPHLELRSPCHHRLPRRLSPSHGPASVALRARAQHLKARGDKTRRQARPGVPVPLTRGRVRASLAAPRRASNSRSEPTAPRSRLPVARACKGISINLKRRRAGGHCGRWEGWGGVGEGGRLRLGGGGGAASDLRRLPQPPGPPSYPPPPRARSTTPPRMHLLHTQ